SCSSLWKVAGRETRHSLDDRVTRPRHSRVGGLRKWLQVDDNHRYCLAAKAGSYLCLVGLSCSLVTGRHPTVSGRFGTQPPCHVVTYSVAHRRPTCHPQNSVAPIFSHLSGKSSCLAGPQNCHPSRKSFPHTAPRRGRHRDACHESARLGALG